ncbi:hypothetical protein SAMN05421882_10414 [Nitrosomonas communis]|uniref:Uncharacterized protein n=1 Tax=Nitrosomonas communis TaxID=44574 RepID=A0A1H2XPC5_9PROT|nr:hypothetical protein SAMN05421882_10414 [Nitrosomonas communis]
MMATCPAGPPKLIQPSLNQNSHASRKLIWSESASLSEVIPMSPDFLSMMLMMSAVVFSFGGELSRSDLIGGMASDTVLHGIT